MSALLRFIRWLDSQLGATAKPMEQETFSDGYMVGYRAALEEAKEAMDGFLWEEGEGPEWEG